MTRIPGSVPSLWRKDLGAETRLPLTAAALDAGILNASKGQFEFCTP